MPTSAAGGKQRGRPHPAYPTVALHPGAEDHLAGWGTGGPRLWCGARAGRAASLGGTGPAWPPGCRTCGSSPHPAGAPGDLRQKGGMGLGPVAVTACLSGRRMAACKAVATKAGKWHRGGGRGRTCGAGQVKLQLLQVLAVYCHRGGGGASRHVPRPALQAGRGGGAIRRGGGWPHRTAGEPPATWGCSRSHPKVWSGPSGAGDPVTCQQGAKD